MKIGKLTDEQLQSLVIGRLPALSATTLSGAGIGADCAWIRTGEDLMVTSSDPITAGGTESGTLAIHVSCNDIAACGVRPSGILIVIIAPPSVTEEDIKMTVDQASREAQALGVDIVGGHTEVSDAVNKMIVVSTAFGLVRKGGCVPLGKAMPGDSLIMTKTAGIEGSFIAANEHKDKLSGKVSEGDIREALSYKNLISVVKEGAACGSLRAEPAKVREDGFVLSAVNLMHDVTEGGVFGAAFEMADFSKTGVVIDKRLVPFTGATKAICSALGLDAFRLISSGSLMIATPEPDRIIEKLKGQGVPAAVIGRFTDRSEGVFYIENDGSYVKLSPPGADEIYSI
ncbi:MAG: AIR synthase family protein [Clostridiales bacterium]|nr:AIR synthase family protein [Clostridiales bacterium]MBR6487599.1 AIR synthase family protein [Clostridiales bacterium]